MGRARALEVMLSAEDYDADLAERYGWINRALLPSTRGFRQLPAHRIAGFPAAGHVAVKDRVNAIALAPVEDFRRDSDLFGEQVRAPDAQRLIAAALKRGFQTREAELTLAQMLGRVGRAGTMSATIKLLKSPLQTTRSVLQELAGLGKPRLGKLDSFAESWAS